MTIVQLGSPAPPALGLGVFGDAARIVEDIAEHKGASTDLVALGLLTSASAFLGVKRRARPWEGWSEPGILWGAAVMPPSQGKSPALDPFCDCMKRIEASFGPEFTEQMRKYEARKLAAETACAIWECEVKEAAKRGFPPPPKPEKADAPPTPIRLRLWRSDITAQKAARLMVAHPGGFLLYQDELSGWLGGFGQFSNGGVSDRAFWLKCYGGRPHRLDRVGDGEFDIPFAAASVLGAITPDSINELVLGGARDGLAARFIFIWPERIPPSRPPEGRYCELALQIRFERLARLRMDADQHGDAVPRDVRLSAAAANAFQIWRLRHYQTMEAADGLYADALGKQFGTVLRIALILEYLDWAASGADTEPAEIGITSLSKAVHIVDKWVTPHLVRVLGNAAMPKIDSNAAQLARWLLKQQPERFNASKLRRKETQTLAQLRIAKDMDDACAALVEANWIINIGECGGQQKGRMTKDFQVNPRVYELAGKPRSWGN